MSVDLLQRLAEAGTPMNLIMEVAETLADARAAQRLLDQRREKDKLRKRLSKDSVETVEIAESVDTPSPLSPPLKTPPDPLKITPPLTPHPRPSAARKANPFPRPEWANPQVWTDLLTNRKRKNLANTPSAHRKLLADIERLVDDDWPPGRVLEAAVSRGWGAIYAGCKDEDDGRQSHRASGQRMGGPGPSSTLAMLRAANNAIARNREDSGGAGATFPASNER